MRPIVLIRMAMVPDPMGKSRVRLMKRTTMGSATITNGDELFPSQFPLRCLRWPGVPVESLQSEVMPG